MQMLTKKTMEKILAQTSHVITVSDFDLIAELDELACEVSHISKAHRRMLREPFELCGILFYPITVAKTLWFNEKIKEWEIPPIYHEAMLFWIMSLPNDSAVFEKYASEKDVDRAVKKLSRRLHCSHDEISEIYCKCLGSSGGSDGGNDVDYGGMIAVLLREYGGTPDQWLCEEPIARISELLRAHSEYVHAQNAANSGGTASAKAVDPSFIQSLAKLRKKRNEIIELWTQADV